MEVKIKGRSYEYSPDFGEGWEFSNGNHYKFPVVIGPEKCFIKRFEKHTDDISGWKLLQNLTGRTHDTLARVYGTGSVIENDKPVHYVFFEYIDGRTLHDFITEKAQLNLTKLTNDLFTAIQILQINGHWFPDFSEKNIFLNNAYFLLTNLDSAHPVTNLPDIDKVCGQKNYWNLVVDYCKDFLNYTDVSPGHFNGASFNYLQIIFLILHLKVYYSIDDNSTYHSAELLNDLPRCLNSISGSFNRIFQKVYQKKEYPLSPQEIDEIKNAVLSDITPLSAKQIKEKIAKKPETERQPVIDTFKADSYIEYTGDTYTIANERNFELSWEVQNASELKLLKNGVIYRTLDGNSNRTEITEQVYNDSSNKLAYTLVAQNGTAKAEKTLNVEILVAETTPDNIGKKEAEVVLPAPENLKIHQFSIRNYIEKNGDQYSVESGQPFTIKWEVAGAQKTELFREDKPVQFNEGEQSAECKEMVYDDAEKLVSYTIKITNDNSSAVATALLTVKVIYTPVISFFGAKNFIERHDDTYVVESGRPFTLTWSVNDTRRIKILKGEQQVAALSEEETSVELNEVAFEGKDKQLTYTLVTFNEDNAETSRKSLNILVKPRPLTVAPEPMQRRGLLYYALCIGIPLVVLFVILYFVFNQPKALPEPTAISGVSIKQIGGKESIVIYGEHFPDNQNNIRVFLNEMPAPVQYYAKEDSLVVAYPDNFSTPVVTDSLRLRIVIDSDTVYRKYLVRIASIKIDEGDTEVQKTQQMLDSLKLTNDERSKKLERLLNYQKMHETTRKDSF